MAKITGEMRKLGKKNPELLLQKLEAVELTDLEFLIMRLRYIDGLVFKQIPDIAGVSERWVYKVHKKAAQKTAASIKLAEWLALTGR